MAFIVGSGLIAALIIGYLAGYDTGAKRVGERKLSAEEREILIESLNFLTGKKGFWWEGKTDQELLDEYDRLQKIY